MDASTIISSDYADLDVSIQAICNIYSGQCFAYELLLRGWERFGVSSAETLLDAAAESGTLADLEMAVRRKAVALVTALPAAAELTLFINQDHRVAGHWDAIAEATRSLLGPHVAHLVTEISAWPAGGEASAECMRTIKHQGGMLAIDRFGATRDGLHLVGNCDPDFIKIDRSLVQGIDREVRKRVILAQLIGMAHTLGIEVIAVGVETGQELTVCRELGCDLVQGHLVQPPIADATQARPAYAHIEALARDERRRRQIDQKWVLQQLETLPAIRVDAPLRDVFERFKHSSTADVVPVVDHAGRALGILRERDLKNFAYSAFGKDLIANRGLARKLYDYMVRCPIADIAMPLDQMLAVYSTVEDADGILVTERMVYRGFLSARSIIRAMHEKTLARARDENPLTKLPGNALITEYVADCIGGGGAAVLAYVDFDNFKPFNDIYGFRLGDRAILLFAELCRKAAQSRNWFLGHIGGDDFFIGIKDSTPEEAVVEVSTLITRFAQDAESFYDAPAREHRSIIAQDREGNVKSFPLLSASAVLVVVPVDSQGASVDDVSAAIAARKKESKAAPDKIVVETLSRP